MQTFRKVLLTLGVLGAIALAVVLVMLVMGSRLPHQHTAVASVDLPAAQDVVWHAISDDAAQSQWVTGLKAVTPLPAQNGHPCWLEHNRMGKLPLCEVAAAPPTLRVMHIADPNLPVGGDWVYQVTPLGPNSARLTITENGTTGPAIDRFFGHYVFGESSAIKQYESDLQKHLAHS